MRKFLAASVAISMGMGVAGASKAADIVIGTPNWPSVQITGEILKVVIEDNIGLEVEIQTGSNSIVFEAMDKGAMHAHPEVWIPNQNNLHNTFVNEKGTVTRNENAVKGFQAMCVSQAVADEYGIYSIFDLTDPSNADLFDSNGDGRGEIWIGAPGWASTNIERIKAKSYGYDQTLDLVEMDETLAYANLFNAVEQDQPWVGFCYSPHYLFASLDMHVLEEPPYDESQWNIIQPTDDPAWLEKASAPVAWEDASLHLYYAKSLENDYPEVASLFANMQLDADSVAAMIKSVAIDGENMTDFAQQWVADNQDRVLDWLSN